MTETRRGSFTRETHSGPWLGAAPYVDGVAIKKNKQERAHGELKAAALAEAKRYLTAHNVDFDEIQFICRRDDEWDAMLYVFHDKVAVTLNVKLPADEEGETADAPSSTPVQEDAAAA
jgi:hypothetical protein